MQRPALYFPFIHVRDDEWLKIAAFYWPSIRRLVPSGYSKHDSPTAKAFFDAGVLLDEAPETLLDAMTWDLGRTLRENATLLMGHYSVERAYEEWDGRDWGEGSGAGHVPQLGWIHVTKFPPGMTDYLSDIGLAQCGRSHAADPWIGLHPALAGAYMTALAGRISEWAHFEPLTDQVDLRIATPSSDVETAIKLLLGQVGAGQQRTSASAVVGVEAYIILALQYVRPKNPGNISAHKIIECRRDLQENLNTFRDYVSSQRAELAELAAIPDRRRRLEDFASHVEHTIEKPLSRLEKDLRLHKLEPTRSLLLAGSFAPPLAAGVVLEAAHTPVFVSMTSGALAAIGNAWWQIKTIRAEARASSPVGYLLDVRDRMTTKTLSSRVRRMLRGTYSRA